MTKHSKEDKEQLISEFKASGLSMTKWCHEKQIPISTFNGWIKKGSKKIKSITTPKFVELTSNTPITRSSLRLTIGSVCVEIDSYTDLNLIARLIKAVNQADV